jgi:OOP family OmpA-OmpF porin
MIDAARQGGLGEDSASSRADVEREMDELRRLLLRPEQEEIVRLQKELRSFRPDAENLSEVLPEAVALRTRKDRQLATALMPTIEEAIGVSVKKNPQRLVEAIFPVMGPAIRKAISHAFGEMVQSLNKTLEHSLSVKGVRWRIEALRTGKSFAEVVLAHSLIYRVEEVFLIHNETSLLLQHVARDYSTTEDSDLFSAMLAAIQDFVRDSLGANKTDSLESLQFGDLYVWVEQGSRATIAAVIRGSVLQEYRNTLLDALDAIHVEMGDALEQFDGDDSPFLSIRPHLESCLLMQSGEESKKPSLALWAFVAVVALGLALWLVFYIRDSVRWGDYIARLKAEPGIVVVSAERSGGKFHVTGLRDPLAPDPVTMLKESSLDREDVMSRWEQYNAADPDFIVARARRLLDPPQSVSFACEGSELRASGHASREWIAQARRLAAFVPGVTAFSADNLVESDSVRRQIEDLTQRVEGRTIEFDTGSAEIRADQITALDGLASDIKMLGGLAQSIGGSIRIGISGFTDPTGTEAINLGLRRERAESILSALRSRGVTPENVSATGADVTATSSAAGRKVTFSVSLVEAAR